MMAITFNLDFSLLGVSAVPLASFAGSLGALAIVYGLSTARRRGTSALVRAARRRHGQALLSAVIAFVQYLADFTQTFRNVRWLMGSLDVASCSPILAALAPMAVAWAGFATLPRMLDLTSVGSESAAARG
jgi:iron complex transport system permease protein